MNTVSCYLMGGLGNQLFQIFATLAYGMQNKRRIIFPYSKTSPGSVLRYTFWETFSKHPAGRAEAFLCFRNFLKHGGRRAKETYLICW